MVRAAAGMVEALPAVTVVGVILAILLVIVVLTLLWYLVLFVFIQRGRRKRAERLAANPDAYPAAPTQEEWRGKQI
jgi:predicted secreted protein